MHGLVFFCIKKQHKKNVPPCGGTFLNIIERESYFTEKRCIKLPCFTM